MAHAAPTTAHTTTASHGNIVAAPRWTLGLRIAQVIFGVIILGLVSYSTSKVHVSGMEAAYGVNLVTVIVTFIGVGYIIVSSLALRSAYNIWAVLGIDIFLTVMWLISFAIMGAMSSSFYIVRSTTYYSFFKRSEPGYIPWETGAAAAGLGGLEFILFIVALVFVGLAVHKHRSATTGTTGATTAAPLAGAPAAHGAHGAHAAPITQEHKYETGPTQEAGHVPHVQAQPQQPTGYQQPTYQQAAPHQPMAQQHVPQQGAPVHNQQQPQYSTAPEVHAPAYQGPPQ